MVETSIIIPVKNTEFLKETLKSILKQTYKNYEVILINDDPYNKNFDKFLKLSKKIKLIQNYRNLGPALSRAKGVKKAKGKFICFIDSDDIIMPEKLEVQLFLMKRNNFKFTFTDYSIIDEKGEILLNDIPIKNKYNYKDYLISRGIVTSTVIIKKNLLNNKILHSTNKYYGEDMLWWLLIMKNYNIHCQKISHNLTFHRKSKNSLSKKTLAYSFGILSIYLIDLNINPLKLIYYIPRYLIDVCLRKYFSKKKEF